METAILTATKARQIAESQEELTYLLDQIFTKAFKGEFNLLLSEEISSDAVAKLEKLGYRVRKMVGGTNVFAIDWL